MPFGIEKRSPSTEVTRPLSAAERRAQKLDFDDLVNNERGAVVLGRYDDARAYHEELRNRHTKDRPEPPLTVPTSWL